ncbi:hypothetical protein [Streptomyces sp. NPDC051214]|uniref:hypothetical protein n=1 Tax=Streptomyces sp. NPDC051214 TaxID=3155282 RepID=UPI00344AB590
MPTATDRTPFTDWLHDHATVLRHLDPAAPLDDLEPLRDLLDGARVVALGEHSHFIDEFAAMRQRILRFLVERCGFTVLAFEYGFCEATPLDAWARGHGADDDLTTLLASSVPIGLPEPLRFLRRHNRTAATPVLHGNRHPGRRRFAAPRPGPRRRLPPPHRPGNPADGPGRDHHRRILRR